MGGQEFCYAARGAASESLIVGETRTAKSSLAEYLVSKHGIFSTFDTEWDIQGFKEGHACAVFHDMGKGFPYWKAVFGCQRFVTVHGRYERTRKLRWNVPSIWVCTYEDDPREWADEKRHYITQNAVIYEIPRGESLYVHDMGSVDGCVV